MTVVIVDLCGTLIHENTTRGFLQYLRRQKRGHRLADIALSAIVSRVVAISGVDVVRPLLIRSLRGMARDFLYREAEHYVKDALRLKLNREVNDLIEERRSRGSQIVLATASLDPIAAAVGRQMSFSRVVSSQLEYRDGICTGRLGLDIQGAKWTQIVASWPEVARDNDIVAITDNEEDQDLRSIATEFHWLGHENAARKN